MQGAPDIAGNLARVRDRISAALARRGPGPDVQLIGVSKRQPAAAVHEAALAGLRDFGENYAQELRDKRADPLLQDLPAPPRWHFIGALQSNKARLVVGSAAIHTVDRPSLAAALDKEAARAALVQDVLVEVNLGGEAQKAGVAEADLPALLDEFAARPHLRCVGLMLIPPDDTPERTRPHFARLRELLRREAARPRPQVALQQLSMGMSGDFEVAIEEGATMVRVGTAIFGSRTL